MIYVVAGAVFAVAWSPESSIVATGGADDRLFLWRVRKMIGLVP
jgi:WD40 repeat protein